MLYLCVRVLLAAHSRRGVLRVVLAEGEAGAGGQIHKRSKRGRPRGVPQAQRGAPRRSRPRQRPGTFKGGASGSLRGRGTRGRAPGAPPTGLVTVTSTAGVTVTGAPRRSRRCRRRRSSSQDRHRLEEGLGASPVHPVRRHPDAFRAQQGHSRVGRDHSHPHTPLWGERHRRTLGTPAPFLFEDIGRDGDGGGGLESMLGRGRGAVREEWFVPTPGTAGRGTGARRGRRRPWRCPRLPGCPGGLLSAPAPPLLLYWLIC